MNKVIATKVAACILLATAGLLTFGLNVSAEGVSAEKATLYERLGAWDGINQVARDAIANHQKNPAISHYFEHADTKKLEAHVTAFFAAGTGGPAKYEGRDMTSVHASMGLSDADFDSAVADVLRAVDKNGIGQAEKAEVAAILESLRPAVMGTTGS